MKDRVFYDQSHHQHQSGSIKWRDYRSMHYCIPGNVAYWLLDQGSLTQRLQRYSGGKFRVRLQRQEWGLPRLNERRILDLRHRELAQIRETVLMVDEQAWVFARSIIPIETLQATNHRLHRLGDRSLGSWLFQAPQLRRCHFQVAQINPACQLVPPHLQDGQVLWGRRSRFEVGGAGLLVSEIFLPHFQPWPRSITPLTLGTGPRYAA